MKAALWISVLRFSDKSEPFGYVLCDSPLLLSCVKYQCLWTSYFFFLELHSTTQTSKTYVHLPLRTNVTIKYKHIPDVFLFMQHISILNVRKMLAAR
jgi:hypothetical protein